jgi:prepilin-type N-terminal cleavage/methylation domain-containing protein
MLPSFVIPKKSYFIPANSKYAQGFTLFEILVATIILSLVILGLTGVFVSGNKHMIHARERITSFELGKLFMDPLQMDVRQDQWDPTNPLLNVTSVSDQVINGRPFTTTYTTAGVAATTLRHVSATIHWEESHD